MIKEFPKLFARIANNKIAVWSAVIERLGDAIDIIVSYGEVGGTLTSSYERGITGKNIGKANETSAFDQAVSQVNSRINKKKREGYKSLQDLGILEADFNGRNAEMLLNDRLGEFRTDLSGNIKPMKCQQYYKSKKNWIDPDGKVWSDRKYYYLLNPYVVKEKGAIQTKFPAIVQPKINGVRAILSCEEGKAILRSKEGLVYDVAHITNYIDNKDVDDDFALDGELYIHGELLQDIVSAVKKPNLNSGRLQFVAFDIPKEEMSNEKRISSLNALSDRFNLVENSPIEVITSIEVTGDDEVQVLTDKYISLGFEGTIIREPKAMYGFGKRPSTITKLKRTISNEYVITDVIPQKKDPTLGQYVCVTPKGNKFEVNPAMSESDKRLLLINRTNVIGKRLQLDFYEYTDKGIPFHILNNLVRDYE